MYTKERIYKTHTKYTNEEKEKIVPLYLNHEMGFNQIIREFDIASKSHSSVPLRSEPAFPSLGTPSLK